MAPLSRRSLSWGSRQPPRSPRRLLLLPLLLPLLLLPLLLQQRLMTLTPDELSGHALGLHSSGMLAMQGVEDPTERRKRSVQRGKGALDVLDDLKLGLLSGNFNASTVSRLRDAAANLKSSSGDPGLDAVLSEIELRVEVELAKAGQF